MPNTLNEKNRAQIELLARRLRVLLDAEEVRRGTEVTFTEIDTYLRAHGITMSRARWSYMINGRRLVDDTELLDAISGYFDVPAGYLRGEAEMPDKVAAELDLVRAMRASRVKSFAARTLGDLSPATLNAITRFLDNEQRRQAGEPHTD